MTEENIKKLEERVEALEKENAELKEQVEGYKKLVASIRTAVNWK